MPDPHAPSRRLVLRLLAGAGGLMLPGRPVAQEAPQDRGIGGTGVRPEAPPGPDRPLGEGDRGIGGTGVIGTIRRFGSIIVNDLRIAYPSDVAVRIDGAPATAADLRIGHVVRVVARPGDGGLSTRRIEVTSEVVGAVEAVHRDGLTVLGQRVLTAGLGGAGTWAVGRRVAVSGLRRPDGAVVASLIEPRGPGPSRVAGPVRRSRDGTPMIGGLRLVGAQALVPGRRALVSGTAEGGVLRVTDATEAGLPPGIARASIEAYVGRAPHGLALGSGLGAGLDWGLAPADVPRRGSVRAVLTAAVTSTGRLSVERLRLEDRLAPVEPRDGGRSEPGRFERERDRLDMRGLPGQGPDHGFGRPSQPGGTQGGFRLDTRPGGDLGMPGPPGPGSNGPGGPGPGGFGPGGMAPGGLGPAAPGAPQPGGFGNPGGLGGPGGGLRGPGGFGGRR